MKYEPVEGGAISSIFEIIAKQAQLQAVNDTMLIISMLTISVIIPVFLLKEKRT